MLFHMKHEFKARLRKSALEYHFEKKRYGNSWIILNMAETILEFLE